MTQRSLSRWLKVILGGIGVCGALVYFYMVPYFGNWEGPFLFKGKRKVFKVDFPIGSGGQRLFLCSEPGVAAVWHEPPRHFFGVAVRGVCRDSDCGRSGGAFPSGAESGFDTGRE